MEQSANYRFLEPRPGSNYRQLFVTGRGLRAETLYRETVGLEPRTPEEVARDFDVPLEAVLEAVRYCRDNEELLRQEREQEQEWIRASGLDRPPLAPPDRQPKA